MESLDVRSILAAVLTSFCVYLVLRKIISKGNLPLPPGPRPLPVLGNLFDIPAEHEHKVYTEWGKKYGDVVHVNALGNRIVILNSIEAAKDLLDGRSTIYSDRPFLPMMHEPSLMDANWAFAFTRYSPEWRRQRRLFTHHLGPAASRPDFLDIHKAAAHGLLRSLLLASGKDLVAQLKHASADASLLLSYGYQMQSKDDPLFAIVELAGKMLGEGVLPGRFLVNVFPWMKYLPAGFPGSGFKMFAKNAREAMQKHIEVPFNYAKDRVAQGTASASFVTSALTEAAPDDLITDVKQVAAVMYVAGADTTSATMHTCILGLVLNPAVQKRAHAELDSVLGSVTSPSFRLPTFADRRDLPFIDAIIKETLRWIPAGALGVPHATTEDDTYRGWRIPKGTIVIGNAWSMLHNEKVYPDPMSFRPERFLGENPAPHPNSQGCFGFGRRDCPGRHIAEASTWMQVASILAAFTIVPAKNKDGRDIDVTYALDLPVDYVKQPQDFPCTFVPRSKQAEMCIRETSVDEYA